MIPFLVNYSRKCFEFFVFHTFSHISNKISDLFSSIRSCCCSLNSKTTQFLLHKNRQQHNPTHTRTHPSIHTSVNWLIGKQKYEGKNKKQQYKKYTTITTSSHTNNTHVCLSVCLLVWRFSRLFLLLFSFVGWPVHHFPFAWSYMNSPYYS